MTKQKFAFVLFLTPALFLIFSSTALADLIPISPSKLKRLPNPTEATTSLPATTEPTSTVTADRVLERAPSPIAEPSPIIAPAPSPLPPPDNPNYNTTSNELPQNIPQQKPVVDPYAVRPIDNQIGILEPEPTPMPTKRNTDTSAAPIGTLIALATLILVGVAGLIIVKLPTTKTPPTEQPAPTPPTDNKPTEPKP